MKIAIFQPYVFINIICNKYISIEHIKNNILIPQHTSNSFLYIQFRNVRKLQIIRKQAKNTKISNFETLLLQCLITCFCSWQIFIKNLINEYLDHYKCTISTLPFLESILNFFLDQQQVQYNFIEILYSLYYCAFQITQLIHCQ